MRVFAGTNVQKRASAQTAMGQETEAVRRAKGRHLTASPPVHTQAGEAFLKTDTDHICGHSARFGQPLGEFPRPAILSASEVIEENACNHLGAAMMIGRVKRMAAGGRVLGQRIRTGIRVKWGVVAFRVGDLLHAGYNARNFKTAHQAGSLRQPWCHGNWIPVGSCPLRLSLTIQGRNPLDVTGQFRKGGEFRNFVEMIA